MISIIDLCLTLPCGLNAICDASSGDVKCSCPENMDGDPKIKCEGKQSYPFIYKKQKKSVMGKKLYNISVSSSLEF